MRKLFRTTELTVRFCERCGQVCDGGRRAALREPKSLQELWIGVRV